MKLKSKLFSTVLILCIIFFSCEKSKEDSKEDESIQHIANPILGKGYDITNRYAISADIKSSILDFDKLYKMDMIQEDKNIIRGTFNIVSGADASEYQTKISTKTNVSVGYKGVFGTEISTGFTKERINKKEFAFATATSRIDKKAFVVKSRNMPEKLVSCVNEEFKENVQNLPAKKIIEIYGTHVMLGGIWGARLDYNMSVEKNWNFNITEFEIFVKAEASAWGVDASAQNQNNSSTSNTFSKESKIVSVHAKGGKPEFGQGVVNKQEYDNWINSIEDNIVWCDYYDNSLVPIYYFIEDETKKEEIKLEVEKYLSERIINVESTIKEGIASTNGKVGRLGFTTNTNGDPDMNTRPGATSRYEIVVKLEKDNNSKRNIRAKIDLKVSGEFDDMTAFEGSTYVLIPFNLGSETCEILGNKEHTFYGTVKGKQDGFFNVIEALSKEDNYVECKFVKELFVQIDGSGNDKDLIGVEISLEVPIRYK